MENEDALLAVGDTIKTPAMNRSRTVISHEGSNEDGVSLSMHETPNKIVNRLESHEQSFSRAVNALDSA